MENVSKLNEMELVEEEVTEVENEIVETADNKNVTENSNIKEETEEFVLETENRGIIDNIKETEGKVKITGHLYGIPVKFDKINQTTVWKTLNRLYDNRENTEDEYLSFSSFLLSYNFMSVFQTVV